MKNRILISGSMAFDLLLTHEGSFLDALDPAALHNLSVCYNTPTFAKAFGGNAVSIGWTFKLLGQDPHILSAVGSDGDDFIELLKEKGIDVSDIARLEDCKTATFIAGTDTTNRQISFFHDGANGKREWPKDLEKRTKNVAYAIITPTIPYLTLEGMHWCKAHAIPCFFDPGQRVMQFTPDEMWEAIRLSAGVFVNAYEADLLTNRLGKTIEKIAHETPFIVVTRDADGFILYEGGRSVGLPRCNADNVVDPTGAGDAFRAGFITGLLHGWTHEQCGQLGAAVASKSVENRGVIMQELDMDDVYDRAEKAYGERLPSLGAF